MDVTMNTHFVIETLKENRKKHVEEYKEQLNGWKEKMEEHNEQMMDWVSNSGANKRPVEPFKPEDYVETYDKYINMMENHIDLRITMSEYEYEQLIEDNFNWKGKFLSNSTLYSNV